MMRGLSELAHVDLPRRLARCWLGAGSTTASRTLLTFLLVALASMLAGVAALALDERQQTQRRQDALARIEQRQTGFRPAPVVPALTSHQASNVANVVDRLNLPWARVLDDLERHTPPSVALLQLEPDVGGASLRLLVEAKSVDDVFAYLDLLKAASSLRRLRIVKYETNLQDSARPARFLLHADIARDAPMQPSQGATGGALAAAVSGSAR